MLKLSADTGMSLMYPILVNIPAFRKCVSSIWCNSSTVTMGAVNQLFNVTPKMKVNQVKSGDCVGHGTRLKP